MQWYVMAFVLFVGVAAPADDRFLVTLEDGREYYGRILVEQGEQVFFSRRGAVLRLPAGEILQRIPEGEIDAEISRRFGEAEDGGIEEYLRLALLCVEVERLAAIDGVLVKARAVLTEARNGSKKTDAAVTPDRPEAATAVDPSWPPVKGASFAVEVKTRLDGKVVDDPAKRAVLVKYLKECAGGYVVRTLDSVRKPDYVIQVGIAVTQGKERDMYGGMPISREWEASCLCRVRAAESGKELYRFELPVLRESASAHLKDAAELTAKNAFNRFISRLQTTPPFQQASPQSEPAKPQAARSRS